jgi:hypothetical protein
LNVLSRGLIFGCVSFSPQKKPFIAQGEWKLREAELAPNPTWNGKELLALTVERSTRLSVVAGIKLIYGETANSKV